MHKSFKLELTSNLEDTETINPILRNDLKCERVEDGYIVVVEALINLLYPVKPHYVPTQKSKGIENCQNKYSALHNEARPKHKEFVFVNTRRFSHIMDT